MLNNAITPAEHERRVKLYEQGLSDTEMAKIIGIDRSSIGTWRRKAGLARKPKRNSMHTPEQRAARMLLYSLGYSDGRIAREQRVGVNSIEAWRRCHRLPPVPRDRLIRTTTKLTHDTTLDRIKRAIGRRLPGDIADDAVGDLYLAVLSGTVCLDKIEAEARKFGNRVLDRFASKFGPRSLDEELGDSDGFRLIDMIRDDRSSSWLEEMGATVW
jgi:hypothetical protein